MNPFSPGDRVQCKEKNRRNGSVKYLICDICEKCKARQYIECTSFEKEKLLVAFCDDSGSTKRFKYHHSELEMEPPVPVKPAQKTYDLSARDIRPLGDAQVSVPLIEDDSGDDGDNQVEESPKEYKQKTRRLSLKPTHGTFFDQFLSSNQNMERPI